jgi:glutathione S-transferase
MGPHNLVALVTCLALLTYFWMSFRVGAARGRFKIPAPATTGNPDFERTFRVQMNTLEWLPIFLPSLWLASFYWGDRIAAAIGVLWIVGRIAYALGYSSRAEARSIGFLIQTLAALILLGMALVGAIRALMATGGV